ncbi:phosphocarrier protein HPr [Candidatus Aerophobetes bacterium]|uniref:Phosphocarrier protein HPr n=1 Tax=Aerophobetes bacterium TaxID=2030807 RepID=A0A2A4YL39_UNCAE|nr:MAG: phosphocarrier protein HPr [Candidatus Aerophobetes bacterium]
MKLTQTVKVKNSLGLHIRPATAIVKLLQNTSSKVFFSFKDMTVNAKSIMSLLILSAQKNATIEITIEGKDASLVMEQLSEGFETKFGER